MFDVSDHLLFLLEHAANVTQQIKEIRRVNVQFFSRCLFPFSFIHYSLSDSAILFCNLVLRPFILLPFFLSVELHPVPYTGHQTKLTSSSFFFSFKFYSVRLHPAQRKFLNRNHLSHKRWTEKNGRITLGKNLLQLNVNLN